MGAALVSLVASRQQSPPAAPVAPPLITTPAGSAAVEQTTLGTRPPAALVVSFDGLGVGFAGPQGTTNVRSPSDNTLAVGQWETHGEDSPAGHTPALGPA